ncbi:MAG TPA: A/G-specific adenine glycosylase [Verrucomicrobia bacterium]|nr:A/G-specific adenine glycosylase [Verrucomicrobiota bacterium]
MQRDLLNKWRRAISERLLPWFIENRRAFPWRQRRTPYRVWISELMLQQTRTEQVVPYFLRFMKSFPTLKALAQAPRQDVLKAWEGLGYYARARNIHETARRLLALHRGRFPREVDGLRALPGIGPYTAAAIASLAFGVDAAVVDGNVIRVLSRLMAFGQDTRLGSARRQFQAWADCLLVKGQSALFNEAMMELGAIVCTPRKPRCGVCPLQSVCMAFAGGDPEAFPRRPKKARVPHKVVGAGVVVDTRGRVLIAQRKDDSMLGGLWEFPGGSREEGETLPQCIVRELEEELGIRTEPGPHLTTVHHAYSHFTIELHAYWMRIHQGRPRAIHCAAFTWVKLSELRKYPFSKADLTIIEALEARGEVHRFPSSDDYEEDLARYTVCVGKANSMPSALNRVSSSRFKRSQKAMKSQ